MPMKLRSLTSCIVLCLVSWTFSSSVLAQNCVIENYALDTNRIDCDGSIQVSGQAFSEVIFGCDFEANGFGGCVGGQATPNGAQFDNPCDPPPPLPSGAPNATYLWMGPGVTQPRFVSTGRNWKKPVWAGLQRSPKIRTSPDLFISVLFLDFNFYLQFPI